MLNEKSVLNQTNNEKNTQRERFISLKTNGNTEIFYE